MMFGYACDETPELMPLPISLAHKLAMQLTRVRKEKKVNYLRPDGKTQVTIEYDEHTNPKRIDAVVVSTQHGADVELDQIRKDMIELVIKPIVPSNLLDSETKIYVNPTGRFVIGGPQGDSGLTGRKIIVDTYGGSAPHGGGPLGGKECGGCWTRFPLPGPVGLRDWRRTAGFRACGHLRHRYRGRCQIGKRRESGL